MAEVFSDKVGPLYLVFWGAKSHVFGGLLSIVVWSLLVKPHENGICPMEKKHRKSSISQILHLWDPTSLEKAASKPSLGKFPLMWLAGDFKTVHLKIRCISEEDHYEPPL